MERRLAQALLNIVGYGGFLLLVVGICYLFANAP